MYASGAERKAAASNQPYGVGPLETCPPAGSPFSDPPSSTRGPACQEAMPAPKSPPKQIVSAFISKLQCACRLCRIAAMLLGSTAGDPKTEAWIVAGSAAVATEKAAVISIISSSISIHLHPHVGESVSKQSQNCKVSACRCLSCILAV